jgi:hypothetical protein
MDRREFLRTSGLAAAAAVMGVAGAAEAAPQAAKGMPTIKLGGLEVSRLTLGTNPFWGYSHKSPALDEEMKKYHTDERILEVLTEAAACGITAVVSPPEPRWIDLWNKYLAQGGRLRTWIAQCHDPADKIVAEIERGIKGGAKAAFIQGGRVDEQFEKGGFANLRAWLDKIKEAGLPGGFAAHLPQVHLELEKRGFPADFYYQCFYQVSKGATYRAEERAQAVETIKQIEKPVVAYKILAAGRLPAEEGFEFAFNNIRRKDGVCVGIFIRDGKDQIRQNTTLTESLSALGR